MTSTGSRPPCTSLRHHRRPDIAMWRSLWSLPHRAAGLSRSKDECSTSTGPNNGPVPLHHGRCQPKKRRNSYLCIHLVWNQTKRWPTKSILQNLGNRRRWPRTVDEAVERLLTTIDIKQIPRYDSRSAFVANTHFRLGMYVRNTFGLWQGNESLLEECGTEDPDKASGVILGALWCRVQDA